MNKKNKNKSSSKREFLRFLKFLMFSCSAGVIQIGTFTLLNEVAHLNYWVSYLIGLVLSVVYNFTINRKFTFKSAKNVPIAMLMVLGYYAVFTPASTLLENFLTKTALWNEYLVTAINMVINFVTEFLFTRFVVYRNSIDNQMTKTQKKEKFENESFQRTISLIGKENFRKLSSANILLVGVGGVGGYIAETLVRAGIGNLTIIDGDKFSKSNLNRQVFALKNTINKDKVSVAKKRLLKINKYANIQAKKMFIDEKTVHMLDFKQFDYVIDAIDFVPGKLAMIKKAKDENVKIISCMGTGNKLHPEMFEIADISKTSVCPLAKTIRKELSKIGIKHLTVLYSKEPPVKNYILENKKRVPSSISTVPSVAGILIANYVLNEIIK